MSPDALRRDSRTPPISGNDLRWRAGLTFGIALLALQARTIQISSGTARFEDIADDIIANGAEGPLCLCHGALGQLEFLTAMASEA